MWPQNQIQCLGHVLWVLYSHKTETYFLIYPTLYFPPKIVSSLQKSQNCIQFLVSSIPKKSKKNKAPFEANSNWFGTYRFHYS